MAEMITTRDIDKTLSLLKRVYNVIVIDTPTTLNDAVLEFLDASDIVLNVVTYDSTTIANSRAMARTYQQIGYPPEKLRYVLNRADSAGGIDPRDLVEQIGHAPDYEVVSDGRLVVESNNQGIPFVLADPTARVSQDLARMAQALTAPTGAAPPALSAVGRR
jgi:pilus assembly protein CpaE